MTMSGHSVITLNDSNAGISHGFDGFSFRPRCFTVPPRMFSTHSSAEVYTSETNAKNGERRSSIEGLKFRCKSKMIRKHSSAFFSFSDANGSKAKFNSSCSYGRRTSLNGNLFKIS